MSKILIFIVSKDSNFAIDEFAVQDFYAKWPEYTESVKIQKELNNTVALPILYNKAINNAKNEKYDFVVLMHADVSLSLVDLVMDIERCKDKYDLIGLCGCSKIDVSQTPLNWFTGSRNFKNDRWGSVVHGEIGNSLSFFNAHSPDVLDHSAACIDGLCIIFGPKALNVGLKFDERLHFNCYDTQISFEALLSKNLKLGVIVEKSLHHYSVGKSILTNDFLNDEVVLRRKYNLGFPTNSKVSTLANLT